MANKKAVPNPKFPSAKLPPTGPFHFKGKRFHFLFAGIVILFSFVIYGNSIPNGYSLDDEFVLHKDTIVQKGIMGIPALFKSRYAWDQKSAYGYRPVVKASFAVEYQFFGVSAHAGHAINIIIYAALVIFLFYFLRKILYKQVSDYFLFLVIGLFLAHPLHTEVVDSLKNRDTMLSFLFGFFCTYSFIKCAETDSRLKQIMWVVIGCFSFNIGYLAKPDAIIFIAITPLVLYFFTAKDLRNSAIAIIFLIAGILLNWLLRLAMIPYSGVFLIIAMSLLYYKLTKNLKGPGIAVVFMFISGFLRIAIVNHILPHSDYHRTFQYFENPLLGSHWYQRFQLGFASLWFYIQKLLFPKDLVSYYGYDEFQPFPKWTDSNVILGIIVAGLIIWLAYKMVIAIYKKHENKNIWLFSLLLFIGTLVVFINVFKVGPGIVAERFMFLPSVGFCLLISLLLFKLFKTPLKSEISFKKFTNLFIVTGLVLVGYSCRVIARNPDWKTHLSIYEHDAKEAPRSAKLQSLLAGEYIDQIKKNHTLTTDQVSSYYELAEKAFMAAVDVYPNYSTSLNNIGMIEYMYRRDMKTALNYFNRATVADTNYSDAWYNAGSAYRELNNIPMAEKYYNKTIQINPSYDMAYIALSRLYTSEGKYDKVLELNENALKKGHATDAIYVDIGKVYLVNGDTTKAITYFDKALGYFSKNEQLCQWLASYYFSKNDSVKAGHYLQLKKDASDFTQRATKE